MADTLNSGQIDASISNEIQPENRIVPFWEAFRFGSNSVLFPFAVLRDKLPLCTRNWWINAVGFRTKDFCTRLIIVCFCRDRKRSNWQFTSAG
jgi:hypothetical protein